MIEKCQECGEPIQQPSKLKPGYCAFCVEGQMTRADRRNGLYGVRILGRKPKRT